MTGAGPFAVNAPTVPWDAASRILHVVRRTERLTRADLVEATGLSRAAVDQTVGGLLGRNLLVGAALGPSAGGRRPVVLSFNRQAGFVIGVQVTATSVDVALSDLSATVVKRHRELLEVRRGPDVVIGRIKALIAELLAAHGLSASLVLGIGIGLPGPIEYMSGRVIAPPIMPGWDGLDIPGLFRSDFACPVYVDNDVNVMALGEQWAGSGRGVDNFIRVNIGMGIGAGIISEGRLHRGADGCAGDIGHIEVDPVGPLCRCGNRGCLEAMAAGAALARLATQAAREGRSPFLANLLASAGTLGADEISGAAQDGDPVALDIIRSCGHLIGRVMAGLVNFFNPSLIIVSGGVTGVGDLLLAGIREVVYRRSTALSTRRLVIQRSLIGDDAGVIGASILAVDELFATRRLDDLVA